MIFDRDKFRVLFYKTGLTQAEFAYKIGKTAGSVSHWIHNVNKPNKETIEKIAEALHCQVNDLLVDSSQENCLQKEKPVESEAKKSHQIHGRRKRNGCL